MNSALPPADDPLLHTVYDLALRRVFGDLSAEEGERLETLVCQDASARRWYVDAMIEAAALHYYSADASVESEPPGPAAPVAEAMVLPGEASTSTSGPTLLSFLKTGLKFGDGQNAFSPLMLLAAVLTASLFWAAIALWVIPLWRAKQQILAETGAPRVAELVAARDCRWGTLGAPQFGHELTRQPLEILSGSIEIEFDAGTYVVIEGPARLQCEAVSRLRIDRGRAVASVPKRDQGFTIVTPAAEVVDLGTEFGVEVDSNGQTEVHTLVGQVEVKPVPAKSSAGATSTEELAAVAPMRVFAGQAVVVEAGHGSVRSVPFADDKFVVSAQGRLALDRARSSVANSAGHNSRDAIRPAPNTDDASDADWPPRTSFVGAIYLGNLFDDRPLTSLARAIRSDELRAVAEVGDLGVERVLYGGESLKQICPRVRFDFTSLGWEASHYGQVTNDTWTDYGTAAADSIPQGGIRTQGEQISETAPRSEDGIGTHANVAITFALDELRAAGQLQDRTLQLVCDRAGINDSGFERGGSIHMAVIVCQRDGVLAAVLNGRPARVDQRDGAWRFATAPGEPLRDNGHFVSIHLSIPASAKYLTLISTSAGDGYGCDQAVWSGIRLMVE